MKLSTVLYKGQRVRLYGPQHQDHISNKWMFGTFYETGKNGMLNACYNLRKSYAKGYAIDAGAHMGNHSVFFAHVLGMKVIAFEPNPESYAYLQANAKPYAITTHNMALGSKPFAKYSLLIGPDGNSGMTRLKHSVKHGIINGTSIDNYLSGAPLVSPVRLIKIDVEGMEMDVLKGAARTIARYLPDVWIETDKPDKCLEMISDAADQHYNIEGPYNATPTYRFFP